MPFLTAKIDRIAMNESGFIFDPQTGASYTTNTTGLAIIRSLQKTRNLDEIKKEIVSEFEVSAEIAERDIIDFMELLKSKGFI